MKSVTVLALKTFVNVIYSYALITVWNGEQFVYGGFFHSHTIVTYHKLGAVIVIDYP